MTQRDSKRKKGKDERKPPDRRNPPPPSDNPDEAAGGDFNVVNLALWAGDLVTAREILKKSGTVRGTPISPFEHPVLASLQRLHRQLVRRLNEYTDLAESADLPDALRTASVPLQSSGGHLCAIIWAESERDYELRCYLRDLSWEKEFYERVAGLAEAASVADAPARTKRRGYGLEDVHAQADEAGGDEAANDIAWATTVTNMFLQPEVSDFCTCSVRGVWTAPELPTDTKVVIKIFQDFLESFDPAVVS